MLRAAVVLLLAAAVLVPGMAACDLEVIPGGTNPSSPLFTAWASSTWGGTNPANVIMPWGGAGSWNSGFGSPGWIAFDFGSVQGVQKIRFLVDQDPSGTSVHELQSATSSSGPWTTFATLSGYMYMGQELQWTGSISTQFLRVSTVTSPSWVAWQRIEFSRCAPITPVPPTPVPPTQDPAVAAFCDHISTQCNEISSECNTLRTLNHVPVSAPNIMYSGNRHLYRIVGAGDISFSSARTAAQAIGAGWDLATLNSEGELAFLGGYLNGIGSGTRVWVIGATRSGTGIWHWVTGESFSFSFFGGVEPTGDGDAGGMDSRFGWRMNDYPFGVDAAGYQLGYIAEKHVAAPTSVIPDNCDASAVACQAVHQDCLDKVAHCPLV